MADDVDIANDLAETDRAALVELQLAHAKKPRAVPVHATDGQRICLDCGVPISHQRLAAVPNAVACYPCEAAQEKRDQQFRRRNPWRT